MAMAFSLRRGLWQTQTFYLGNNVSKTYRRLTARGVGDPDVVLGGGEGGEGGDQGGQGQDGAEDGHHPHCGE